MSARRSQHGYVLVTVLVALAVLALIAARYATTLEKQQADVRAMTLESDAELRADGMLQTLLFALTTRRLSAYGIGQPPGAVWAVDGRWYRASEGLYFSIQDERGLLPVHEQDQRALARLLEQMGVPMPRQQRMLDVLADYIDTDNLRRLSGAEEADYRQEGLPPPRNDFLRSLAELQQMPVWRDDLVLLERLAPLLSLRVSGLFNPNSAPAEVLKARLPGASPAQIETFVRLRAVEPFLNGRSGQQITGLALDRDDYMFFTSNELRVRVWAEGMPRARAYNLQIEPGGLYAPWLVVGYQSIQRPNFANATSPAIESLHRFLRSHRELRPEITLSRQGLRGLGEGKPRSRQAIVIARSLLRVRSIRLPEGLSPSDRWGALRAQALAWQPFPKPSYRLGLQGSHGLVIAWDEQDASKMLREAGLSEEAVLWVPELLLTPPDAVDEVRLLEGLDGFEAQAWQAGVLTQSRWWPVQPDARAWAEFCRLLPDNLQGVNLALQPRALANPVPSAWIQLRSPDEDGVQTRKLERWLVAGVALVLIAGSIPVLRDQWSLRHQRQELRDRLVQQRADQAPALARQQRALALLQELKVLERDLRGPQPLQVLAHLAEVLPAEGVLLREMDLEGRRLRLVFELNPGVSRGALVARLQRGAWFAEVLEQQAVPRPGWVAYQVQLAADIPVPSVPASSAPAASNPAGERV